MQYRKLAHTDLEVSRLCMGTMTFGSQAGFAESDKMIRRCLDTGINFFDTANVYNQGLSEEYLGRALGARRKEVVLASKVRGEMGEPPEYSGLSRKAVRRALEDSLRRLQTGYLDIYYLHQPDYAVPVEETLEVLEELREEGKIRYGGVSNYSAWQICEILWVCENNGWPPPRISQPMYNVLARGIEQEYLPFCKRFGVSVVAYNPLAGGLLTGKHDHRSGPLAGTRFDGNSRYLDRYWHPDYFAAVEKLNEVVQRQGRSLIETAFLWLLAQEHVDAVIVGASRLEQLDSNLEAAAGAPLLPEILETCDAIWRGLRGVTPAYNR